AGSSLPSRASAPGPARFAPGGPRHETSPRPAVAVRAAGRQAQLLVATWVRPQSPPASAADVGPRPGPLARVSPTSRGGETRPPRPRRGRAGHPEQRGPDRSDLADATPQPTV